ncbi:BEN domain-containing protein 2 isoform X2 [Vicugna pacos]|uniref:BEN domain-containing protein 2 isoform X2 n=1 Tax=Vicugna pacos TaxID=30538 RepID=A0ABM5CUS8_VICPA
MSEKQDYVVITIEDSDDDDDNVIMEESNTEITENTFSSDKILTVQPDFQGNSDNAQQPSQLSYGVDDQAVSEVNHPANLKRYSLNSADVGFIPLHKKGRLSVPRENNMVLQELLENIERQVNRLCEIVSRMQHSLEKSLSLNDGDCNPTIPVERQENGAEINPVGTSLQSAALPKLQEPVLTESPPLPKIVSSYSLQPCLTPGSPFSDPGVPSFFSEGAESTNSVISPAQANLAVPTAVLPQGEPSLADTPKTPSTIMENNSVSPDTALPPRCILPNSEMPGKEEISLENSTESVHYPTLFRNDSGQDTASSSIFIPLNFNTPETSLGNNPETKSNPTLLINDSGQCSSSFILPPNFAVEKFILIEMPGKAENNLENSSQTMYYPALLGNISGPDTNSSSYSVPTNFALEKVILIETPGKAEASVENSSQTNSVGNDSGPDTASSTHYIPHNFGYLGDPKRNVRILDIHLMTAQKKTKPNLAARYLVRILFSKETLMSSSVSVNSKGRQPLDPNKMAAIREYLAAVFPNHDLREHGKDWQACISDINALIWHLCFEAKRKLKTVDNNKDPTNPDRPTSADSNDKRNGSGGESSSQLSQQAAVSETRENGNSQQNISALPEGIKEPSTDNSMVSYETLEYLGNPCRNIQLPKLVLNIAKQKSCPELSARYLIRNLFTEEILIQSNVYGTLGRGVFALDSNKINALREFLQDIYPASDLSETGRDWKLCVTAINSCIRSLRYHLRNSTSKSQSPPTTTS